MDDEFIHAMKHRLGEIENGGIDISVVKENFPDKIVRKNPIVMLLNIVVYYVYCEVRNRSTLLPVIFEYLC